MLWNGLVGSSGFSLVSLHEDEDIVDTNGQHEERDDFNDDESGWESNVTEDTDGTDDRCQDDQYAA